VLAELLRVLPVAVLVATMPGYFWARCLVPSGDRVELLAYSTALSLGLVPAAALAQTSVLGSGVTSAIAVISPATVLASGLVAYLWLGPAGDKPPPAPPAPLSVRALVPLAAAFGLVLATFFGLVTDFRYAAAVALLVLVAGVVGSRAPRDPVPGEAPPAAPIATLWWPAWGFLLVATLVLVLVRGYWGPVAHDWPFIRGGDQYSHAVMSGLMLTEGQIDSYLVYPPGFHTMAAIISRLSGLEPLEIFPVLAPALLVLPALACYALSARLWGRGSGVAAAFFCGVLLVGPYESLAEARYPNVLSADFLIVVAVAGLIRVYASPGVRGGVLFALLGSSVVLYHQVGSFYLALLLALAAVLFLPYLLLTSRRKEATALFLSLALLGLLSVLYAWDTYDLGQAAAGLLGSSDTGAGGTAVAIAIGSQEPLSLEHLLETTSRPVAWLGLLGAVLATAEVVRGRVGVPRALAYLTVALWALLLFAGSRTSLSGFPQRFERDLGLPLAVLAAFAFVGLLRAIPAREPATSATRLVAALATVLAIAMIGMQGSRNLEDAGRASPNVISEDVAAAGEWLGEHHAGQNIVVTPYLNDHIPGSAMLAMGGYTGLRSYTQERLRTPRALPPSGKEPLLAASWMMRHPVGERTETLLDRYDVGYVVLFKRYPDVPWRSFDRAQDAYEKVFENGAVVVFAPR
jgi:hypothetical protein